MKTTFRYNSGNNRGAWPPWLAQMLTHLDGLAAVTAAEVVMEHQSNAEPTYRVQVRLDLPGPGVHGAGSDNILEEAVLKATQDLVQKIQPVKSKPLRAGKKQTAAQRRSRTGDRSQGVRAGMT